MWQVISDILKEYGLFPAGIMIGIWLTKWATSEQRKYMELDKKGFSEEKKVLLEVIESQQKRIDKLHKQLPMERKP